MSTQTYSQAVWLATPWKLRLVGLSLGAVLGGVIFLLLVRGLRSTPGGGRSAASAAPPVAAPATQPASARDPLPSPVEWAKAVDLLAAVDTAKDVAMGQWTLAHGVLTGDNAPMGAVRLPYQPPASYDLRLVCTRLSGSEGLAVKLVRGEHRFHWLGGAMANSLLAFGDVNGNPPHSNPTTVRRPRLLRPDEPCEIVLRVRPDGVTAYLDGRPATWWRTDYADLTPVSIGMGPMNGGPTGLGPLAHTRIADLRNSPELVLITRSSAFAFEAIQVLPAATGGQLGRVTELPALPLPQRRPRLGGDGNRPWGPPSGPQPHEPNLPTGPEDDWGLPPQDPGQGPRPGGAGPPPRPMGTPGPF